MNRNRSALGLMPIGGLLALLLMVMSLVGYWQERLFLSNSASKTQLNELQLLSHGMVDSAHAAIAGDGASFQRLRLQRSNFSEYLARLQRADSASLLTHNHPFDFGVDLAAFEEGWRDYDNALMQIIGTRTMIATLHQQAAAMTQSLSVIQNSFDEAVDEMLENRPEQNKAPFLAVTLAKQLTLLEKMQLKLTRLLAAQGDVIEVSTNLVQDSTVLGQVIESLLVGNEALAFPRVTNPQYRRMLLELQPELHFIAGTGGQLLEASQSLADAQQALERAKQGAVLLNVEAGTLLDKLDAQLGLEYYSGIFGMGMGATALLLLLWLGQRHKYLMRRVTISSQANQEVQQQVVTELKSEMSDLASGQLRAQLKSVADVKSGLVMLAVRLHKRSSQIKDSEETLTKAFSQELQGVSDLAQTFQQVQTAEALIEEQVQAVQLQVIEGAAVTEMLQELSEQASLLSLNAAIQLGGGELSDNAGAAVSDSLQKLAEKMKTTALRVEPLVQSLQIHCQEALTGLQVNSSAFTEVLSTLSCDKLESSSKERNKQLAELFANQSKFLAQQAGVAKHLAEAVDRLESMTSDASGGVEKATQSLTELMDNLQAIPWTSAAKA